MIRRISCRGNMLSHEYDQRSSSWSLCPNTLEYCPFYSYLIICSLLNSHICILTGMRSDALVGQPINILELDKNFAWLVISILAQTFRNLRAASHIAFVSRWHLIQSIEISMSKKHSRASRIWIFFSRPTHSSMTTSTDEIKLLFWRCFNACHTIVGLFAHAMIDNIPYKLDKLLS